MNHSCFHQLQKQTGKCKRSDFKWEHIDAKPNIGLIFFPLIPAKCTLMGGAQPC